MKKKILFVADWPDHKDNLKNLQALLDKDHSEKYEWKVWSCKKGRNNKLWYRWMSYTWGAMYVLKNRKKYHAIFFWQQMVAYILFQLLSITRIKIPNLVYYTYINYHPKNFAGKLKKHFVKQAFKHTKAAIWPSVEMLNDVNRDFPGNEHINHYALNPIMDVIEANVPVDKELDDPYFRNGVFTAGKSEREYDQVVRAFRNTDIPVTIVCDDDYVFTEKNITSNIRVLRFAQVSPVQYYALADQAFCILNSVINEKSPCGQILVAYALENAKPVISTNCYGVKDYIVNNMNGILFEAGQADEILKAYEKLKNDAEFTKSLVENGLVSVKKMNAGSFIEKVISIIEK